MPGGKEPPLGADGKKLIRRLASSFAECSGAAKAYGACVAKHFDSVSKGDCQAEFVALQQCFRTSMCPMPSTPAFSQ